MPRAIHAAIFCTLAATAAAQDAKPSPSAPAQLTTQQDHKLMMEALGIKSLREGADLASARLWGGAKTKSWFGSKA